MVNDELFRRRWLIIGLTFAIVTIFIIRLFTLQVASNDYKRRAENNAYFILSTIPSRGVIYDRKGQLLVANRPIYDLMIVNHEAKGKLDTTLLASTLGCLARRSYRSSPPYVTAVSTAATTPTPRRSSSHSLSPRK